MWRSAQYLGDMWFWDSALLSLPTVLVGRSVLTSQLLTSPGPLSSGSGSWTTKGKNEPTGGGEGEDKDISDKAA